MVNALTAASGLSTPAVWGSPVGLELMIKLATEAALVAQGQGRPMRPIKLIATETEMSAELLRRRRSRIRTPAPSRSRAADGQRGRRADGGERRRPGDGDVDAPGHAQAPPPFEIDYLERVRGARRARGLAVATPANAAAVALLRAVAAGEERQDATQPRPPRGVAPGLMAASFGHGVRAARAAPMRAAADLVVAVARSLRPHTLTAAIIVGVFAPTAWGAAAAITTPRGARASVIASPSGGRPDQGGHALTLVSEFYPARGAAWRA